MTLMVGVGVEGVLVTCVGNYDPDGGCLGY